MPKAILHSDLAGETPAPSGALFDLGFLEARSKVLDLAAFLDRIGRHGGELDDYRARSLMAAIRELVSDEPGRAARILDLLSDPSTEPVAKAPGKAANGAWEGFKNDEHDTG